MWLVGQANYLDQASALPDMELYGSARPSLRTFLFGKAFGQHSSTPEYAGVTPRQIPRYLQAVGINRYCFVAVRRTDMTLGNCKKK